MAPASQNDTADDEGYSGIRFVVRGRRKGAFLRRGTMKPKARLILAVSLVLVPLVLAGCGQAFDSAAQSGGTDGSETVVANVTPAPTQTSVPNEPIPTLAPGQQYLYEISTGIDQEVTPEYLAGFSRAVFVGTVRDHLEPRWATADGSRPKKILGDSTMTMFTPVIIELDRPPLMDLDGRFEAAPTIVAFIEGGTIGDVTIAHDGSFYDLPVGAKVVVGADPVPGPHIIAITDESSHVLLPEGYATGWLPNVRFIYTDVGWTSDGFTYSDTAFFERLDSGIRMHEARQGQ